MALASAQLEDLLGDYLNGGQTSEASTNHSFSNLSDFSDINSNWSAGYVKIALATDTAGSLAARFDSFTEVSGNNYSRVSASTNSGSSQIEMTTSSTDGSWENQYDISFPTASGSWGTITYAIFYYDDGTDTFPLIACPLATSQAVGNNDTLTFSAGNLKYTIA